MKKIIPIIAVVAIILIIVVACFIIKSKKGTDKPGVSNGGVTLELDMAHFNEKVYTSHFDLSGDIKVAEFDEDEPETVRLENEKEKYVIDITLDEDAKEAVEQFNDTAKTCENYTDTKFGKYEGYSYLDNEDMVATIILDKSDENANVYVLVSIYFDTDSDDEETGNIEQVYKSSSVQNLLNSISYKSATAKPDSNDE